MELTKKELEFIFEQGTTEIEMLWDVYPTDQLMEEVGEEFMTWIKLVHKLMIECGFELPTTTIFQQGWLFGLNLWTKQRQY